MTDEKADALELLKAIAVNTTRPPRPQRAPKPVDEEPVRRATFTPMKTEIELTPVQIVDKIVASHFDKDMVEAYIANQALVMKALTLHQAVELLKSADMDILKSVVPKFMDFVIEKPKQTHVLEPLRSGQAQEIDPALKLLHEMDAAEYGLPAEEETPA
jgi:translation elongation factor EF-Ts